MVTADAFHVIAEVARGIPVLAGVLTGTEAVTAMTLGASAVKLFAAGTGGPAYLRALRGPLPGVPVVPVGGVDAAPAAEHFAAGAVAAAPCSEMPPAAVTSTRCGGGPLSSSQ